MEITEEKLIIEADKKRIKAFKESVESSLNELPIMTKNNCIIEFQDKEENNIATTIKCPKCKEDLLMKNPNKTLECQTCGYIQIDADDLADYLNKESTKYNVSAKVNDKNEIEITCKKEED